MNVEETIELLAALKDAGAVHFKSHDFEVHMRRGELVPARKSATPPAPKERASYEQGMLRPDPAPVANAADTERAEQLLKTLKNPERLLDAIFPDVAGGE